VILIPIRAENPARRWAWVTSSLVAANLAVFAVQLSGRSALLIQEFGFVPRLASADSMPRLIGSMFLHGGVLHITSNLIYLWIFGNNVEDVLGPVRFLALYLLSGLGGHAAHFLASPQSMVPTIGASGAISGLLAAYWIRFPRARIHTILFLFVFIRWIRLPAGFLIGYWLLLQLVSGIAQLGGGPDSGVAWFEHIGGFGTGAALFLLLGGRSR
jgi:rhomboid family protein